MRILNYNGVVCDHNACPKDFGVRPAEVVSQCSQIWHFRASLIENHSMSPVSRNRSATA